MRKRSLIKKLRGYQKASRERFLLLKNGVLSLEEFAIYELGIAITDWDKTHTDTYGTFETTNMQLAEILGWKGDSTASRHKTSLIKKGFITPVQDDRYIAKGFQKWELRRSSSAFEQEAPAEIQTHLAKLQNSSAKTNDDPSYLSDYSLVSSKGSVSLRNDDEYQAIKEEMEFKGLTVEDMKWIDQNVKESPNVPS